MNCEIFFNVCGKDTGGGEGLGKSYLIFCKYNEIGFGHGANPLSSILIANNWRLETSHKIIMTQ